MKQEENLILRQNDIGNKIVFIFDSNLTDITSAEFRLIKPDNTFVIITGTVEENTATFTITEQCCTLAGRCHFNLRLINSSSNIYTYVSNCIIDINLNLEDAIESTAEANGYTFPDDFLTSTDLSNYATKSYVDTAIENVPIYTPISYSIEEQDTGLKWVDGKTIYQKSVNANINLTSSWVDVLTLTDADTVIDVSEIIYRDGERCQTPFSTGTNFAKWIVRNGVLKYSMDGSSSDTMHLDWVTVKYTKLS